MAEAAEYIFEDTGEDVRDLGRRERKKLETRQALEEAALELFRAKGYDQTKIEDITETVDVSARTFFRYFDSKEAVIFGDWQSQLHIVADFIRSRPKEEHPLVTMKEFCLLFAQVAETQKERMLLMREMTEASRTIGNYENEVLFPTIEEVIAGTLAERMGVDVNKDMKPCIYAGVTIVAVKTARDMWLSQKGKKLFRQFVDEAFDIVLNLEV